MSIEDELRVKAGGFLMMPPTAEEKLEAARLIAKRREELNATRERYGMLPATFHFQDPTPEMQTDPLWNAIWDEIKPWDIHVPSEYSGVMGATGNHVTAIFRAIERHMQQRLEDLASQFDLSELSVVVELKKQIQVAHNLLLTEFGRTCYPADPTRKCEICEEVEKCMSVASA
jgi:hypothetical protein